MEPMSGLEPLTYALRMGSRTTMEVIENVEASFRLFQ
jgi:hypothetical protein